MIGSVKWGSFVWNEGLVGFGQGSLGRKAGRGNRYESFCNVCQAVEFRFIHRGDLKSLQDL